MIIAGVDVVTSKLLQRRVARRNKIDERKSKEVSKLDLTFVNSNDLDKDKSSSSESKLDDLDREFVPAKSMKPPSETLAIPSTSQMRININKLALVCDRTGVSDRVAAMLSSAVLQDVGIITLEDQSKVIDRSKIRQARKNVRKAIQNIEIKSDIEGIYFDDGPKHLLGMIQRSRFLPQNILKIIDPVIERNAYLLICMLNDTKRYLRELALRRILKTRNGLTRERMREFIIPKINFEATTYNDLIDWQNCELSEPSILASISNDDLNQLIQTVPEMDLVKFPCHTQAVERHVKIVSEASLSVSGKESRDGYVMAKLQSRSEMPVFETKKEYK
ncbi:hypothetical protein RN001_004278 [Aquatica leii]|uniref:Uncharacterized protein n=1 Tax=Aquatica leii TaxID=1421715 RepID=A0AAN7PB60_9COLE|nr:hypothetical protein RN001_004278 [Aquatica leii]